MRHSRQRFAAFFVALVTTSTVFTHAASAEEPQATAVTEKQTAPIAAPPNALEAAHVPPAAGASKTSTTGTVLRAIDPTFGASGDDDSVPSFLRALQTGHDSLLLGGWIRPGYTYVTDSGFNDDDADGFEFYDARLVGRGDAQLHTDLRAAFRFNFDVNRGNFAVRDTYGTLEWKGGLVALDVGLLKTPLSLSLLQTQAKMQFPVNTLLRPLAFGRDVGAQLRSQFALGKSVFQLSAMVSNGDGGFRQRRNLDDKYLVTGRIEAAPLGAMEQTESDLANSPFQLTMGASAGHNSALTSDLGIQDAGAAETRIEGDVRAWYRGATLRAEYIRGHRRSNDAAPSYQRYGFAAQAGYVLPLPLRIPRVEVVGRFQQIDVNSSLRGDEATDYIIDNAATRVVQLGANAYFAKHAAKLQVTYQRTDLLEGTVPTRERVPVGDALLTSIQFAWL